MNNSMSIGINLDLSWGGVWAWGGWGWPTEFILLETWDTLLKEDWGKIGLET